VEVYDRDDDRTEGVALTLSLIGRNSRHVQNSVAA